MSFVERDIEAIEQEISQLYSELVESGRVLQTTPKERKTVSRSSDSAVFTESKSRVPRVGERAPSERNTRVVNFDDGVSTRQTVSDNAREARVEKDKLEGNVIVASVPDNSTCNSNKRSFKSVVFKPSRYDGTTSWLDYKSHFEMCSIVNEWDIEQQGLYLAVSLSGLAQSVLGDLPLEMRKNYTVLVKALEDRFLPTSQTELYRVQMRERRQKASESLPELGQSIRRLANLAYPTAPLDVRETLAKEQFLDALVSSEIRLRVKQSRPQTLDEAIRLAVELEAYDRAEGKHYDRRGLIRQTGVEKDREEREGIKLEKWMRQMESNMQTLTNELKQLKVAMLPNKEDRQPTSSKRVCFKCGRPDHLANECWIKCKNCGKSGHLTSECRYPKKCFKCKNIGHMASKCPENQDVDQEKKQVSALVKGKQGDNKNKDSRISSLEDGGMFVEVEVQGEKATFLVDTGATLTLVSTALYDRLAEEGKPKLKESDQTIQSVCGTSLFLKGKGSFEITFGNCVYDLEAVVANLKVDGIIGLDFLKSECCTLDIVKEILTIQNEQIPLRFRGSLGCSQSISILSSSESFANGNVCLINNQKQLKGERPVKGKASKPHSVKKREKCKSDLYRCGSCVYNSTRFSNLQRHKRAKHGSRTFEEVQGDISIDSDVERQDSSMCIHETRKLHFEQISEGAIVRRCCSFMRRVDGAG